MRGRGEHDRVVRRRRSPWRIPRYGVCVSLRTAGVRRRDRRLAQCRRIVRRERAALRDGARRATHGCDSRRRDDPRGRRHMERETRERSLPLRRAIRRPRVRAGRQLFSSRAGARASRAVAPDVGRRNTARVRRSLEPSHAGSSGDSRVTAVERTPFYFGNESRALFGWLHAPKNEARDLVVVICPPVGHEYINAHRSLRRLADELALAGVAAFRFDYDGCGDSAGSDEDADRMGAWRSSVVEAFREAKRASGCSRIAAVGLRMGATLAALVSEHEALDALVLWAPCVRGRGYVRELKALAMTGGNRNAGSADGAIEPGGFTFSKDTQAGLACLDLSAAPPSARQIFISPRDDLPDDGALYTAWSAAGRRVEQRSLPGFAGMVDVPHNTVVPERAIAEIVGWLAARAGGEITLRRPPSLRQSFTANGVRETIVHVRGEHGFFGILCEPVNAARGPVVLLSNAGATHHVGPNRLYVMAARALAAAGLRSLRLDLPGLGDNPAPDAEAENRPYVPSASAVIASAVAALRQ